ncbi:hypothetical protein ACU6T4_09560 [Avibacterium paragallinarum]|uniref:hypothetical protein n=1 Tax=Avibacterium paragallinarum TaxID=728 RepID=UPI00021AD38A|nr:hypothetical protein [Avibacterium paragallinarum]AZI13628.1 hypothetical protein EIA51_02610 [Avibacterium paragallinarum]QIR12059.1 hypothetical protein HBL79_07330 [Avibacterium paragallinarum]QJE09121.1 hypothetical protein HHJ62_01710 [Avibacterium paragallinarum]QJE11317.1 hypothetical protein HHJ61_01710 [Avibacterium paragallinarum]QJE13514.1 hypothetical protein HHJ60_01715 [Avibacterium paragallinarum]
MVALIYHDLGINSLGRCQISTEARVASLRYRLQGLVSLPVQGIPRGNITTHYSPITPYFT